MSQLIRDLLESPPWVIATFMIGYTLVLSILVWKISGWYNKITEWNKHRTSEKAWKEKVTRLEKENLSLQEKSQKNSDSSSK